MTQTALNSGDPRFLSFEGGEGAGKSTQIKLLSAWLTENCMDHIITREPGGAPGAELIRDLLLKGDTDRWQPMTEALLMTASRAEHVARTIKPALEAGKWVLCDRFFDSTIAYQGYARGLGGPEMRDLQTLALGAFQPDLTFVFDIEVEKGLMRARGREDERLSKSEMEDRFERMDITFHKALHSAFLKFVEDEPERCIRVDADGTPDEVQRRLRSALIDHLSQ